MGTLFGIPGEFFVIGGIISLNLILMIWSWRAQNIFPSTSTVRKRYQDQYVSGYSDKNTLSTITGARRSLEIIVTDDELWIRPSFRLTPFGKIQDLIHKIPLENITSVTEVKDKYVQIKFRTSDQKLRGIYLTPIRLNEFRNHVLRKLHTTQAKN